MKAGGAAEITRTKLLYPGISYYYLMDWEKSVQCLEEFQSRFEEVPQSESLGLMLQHDLLVIDEYFPDFSEINGNVVNIAWSNHPEKCFTELIGKLEEQRKRWENELLDGDSSNMVRYMNTACFADEAVCHMKMEQYEKAVKACEKALFWDHSSPEILYIMGQSLNMQERYTEALDCFEKALKYQDHAQRAYEIRTRIQEIRDMMKTSDEFRNSFIRRMFAVAKKKKGNPAELQKLISGKEEIFDEAFLGLLNIMYVMLLIRQTGNSAVFSDCLS